MREATDLSDRDLIAYDPDLLTGSAVDMVETETVVPSEATLDGMSGVAQKAQKAGRLFSLAFFLAIAAAMFGWLSFLSWIALKLFF